jgi:hypothetical protein
MTYILSHGTSDLLVDDDRTEVLLQSRRMAVGGLRVLAVAYVYVCWPWRTVSVWVIWTLLGLSEWKIHREKE